MHFAQTSPPPIFPASAAMSMAAHSTSTGQNVARTLVTAAAAGFGAWLLYRFWRLPAAPRSVRPGINDPFSANSPQAASEFVGRFETESREIFNLCPRVVQQLNIKPGQRVADLGAGTGLFMEPLAKAVSGSGSASASQGSESGSAGAGSDSSNTQGHVYALDPCARFVTHMSSRLAAWPDRALASRVSISANTDFELGDSIPSESLDWILAIDTYHHLEYPSIILRDAWTKLRRGGRLAILDFERIPGVSSEWVLGHVRAGREVVLQEITEARFKLQGDLKESVGLKENYLMVFVKE